MVDKLKPHYPNKQFLNRFQDDLFDTNIFLMRHATSDMNEAMTHEVKKNNYLDVALNRDLQDATLSTEGM